MRDLACATWRWLSASSWRVEGLVFADAARRAISEAVRMPSDGMRLIGVASAVAGVAIVWLARGGFA